MNKHRTVARMILAAALSFTMTLPGLTKTETAQQARSGTAEVKKGFIDLRQQFDDFLQPLWKIPPLDLSRGPAITMVPFEQLAKSFERLISLNSRVDTEKAEATLKNGLLTVVLPKISESRVEGRKISIRRE